MGNVTHVLICTKLFRILYMYIIARVNNREESIKLPYGLSKLSGPIPLALMKLLN